MRHDTTATNQSPIHAAPSATKSTIQEHSSASPHPTTRKDSPMGTIHHRLTTAYASAYTPFIPPTIPRRASTTPSTTMPPSPQEDRHSNHAYTPALHPVRTRSVGGFLSAGVIFERDPSTQPTDEDIIIVTVRISRKQRRNSYDDPLPDRPQPRGFFRRMSTRVLAQPSPDKYKAVKMPRGEYARYFKHDARGLYVGTEPEREWEEEEVMEKYGQYQDLPLRSILGRTTTASDIVPTGWGT